MPHYDIAIVGAGAAGLATGIFARTANPAASVVLIEGARKPGAKILVSGGGRCNVTNGVVTEGDFWGGRPTIVRQVLRQFPVSETVAFFRKIGVSLHAEADGKLFPDSNRARDVIEALLRTANATGVTLLTGHRVLGVAREPNQFRVGTAHGALTARAVVLATGGRSLPKTGSDGAGYAVATSLGHSLVAVTPGLAPLVLSGESPHATLAGVSHEVELTIWVNGAADRRLRGALLWTHFGISGPVAMNVSRHWARARLEGKRVAITANFSGVEPFERTDARLMALARDRPKASMQTALSEWLPASVSSVLLSSLDIASDLALGRLSREGRRRVAHALTEWPVPVVDTRGYNYAEVTAGGVRLSEIDPSTMESRVCAGLYLVGEILDVDGRIGGFNFQWAWSSAWVAAQGLASAARLMNPRDAR
jgi:predicted Rossmann fold flavoprotein